MAAHLAEVAGHVADETNDEVALAGAWLHDVIEDTDATLSEIHARFGQATAELVGLLTDAPEWASEALPERKRLQSLRIGSAPEPARLVKLADQISNIRSVIFDPPVNWDTTKCLAYIDGACRVGRACSGVSARLDALLEHYVQLARQPG